MVLSNFKKWLEPKLEVLLKNNNWPTSILGGYYIISISINYDYLVYQYLLVVPFIFYFFTLTCPIRISKNI